MNLKMVVGLGSLGALQALANLLEENGYDEATGEFSFYDDGETAPATYATAAAPLAPAAPPVGAPSPPTAGAGDKPKRTRRTKAGMEADAALPGPTEFLGQPVADPLPVAAAPAPPPAAVPPPPPAAPPAAPAAAAPALVAPADYVAPATITVEHLQKAMAGLLGSGMAASLAQAFLAEVTGYKAIKDLPPEWYPRAHWALSTGVVPD